MAGRKTQARENDRGQDACSYYFPDMKRIVWTSTRDNMDMPLGDWSSQDLYPQGAELYTSDLEGKNIQRLTNNKYYEAEVSVSPNGEWIVFGRQIDGKLDLWRMRPDGSDEQQITNTEDWQEGAPFYLPDNETILFRAWKREDYGKIYPTPMTVFTIKHDGTERTARTFDRDMNWAPYPAPDGRHYVFVRVVPGNNWEVFLGDLAGGEPVRLTYNEGFDGLPSLSPDGTTRTRTRKETTIRKEKQGEQDDSAERCSAFAENTFCRCHVGDGREVAGDQFDGIRAAAVATRNDAGYLYFVACRHTACRSGPAAAARGHARREK